jgi:hypothetical protein
MVKRDFLISSKEKGRIREAAWVESREVEATSWIRSRRSEAGRGGAEKLFKEIMKDGCFGWMGENRVSKVRVESFYLVLTQPPRGTEVEISGVLISELDVFDLSAVAPVGSFFIVFLAEPIFSKAAKASF